MILYVNLLLMLKLTSLSRTINMFKEIYFPMHLFKYIKLTVYGMDNNNEKYLIHENFQDSFDSFDVNKYPQVIVRYYVPICHKEGCDCGYNKPQYFYHVFKFNKELDRFQRVEVCSEELNQTK